MPKISKGTKCRRTWFEWNRQHQLEDCSYIVTRHNHFHVRRQLDFPTDISCPEVELWSVIGEEGSVATTFILGKDVNLGLKLFV